MALFRPDLARTCFPGCSVVPAADLDMFRTCKSSIHPIAWFWLIALLNFTRLIKGPFLKKIWLVALIAGLHGFLFGQTFAVVTTWIYHGSSVLMFERGWVAWTLADIPWEIAQCIVGVGSSLILLPPVYMGTKRALRNFGK